MKVTEDDALSLMFLLAEAPGVWRLTPACFRPNPRCLDQEARGLLEIVATGEQTHLRLTPEGRRSLDAYLGTCSDA